MHKIDGADKYSFKDADKFKKYIKLDLSNWFELINPSFKFLYKTDNFRFIFLQGGAGSGKSYSLAQFIIFSCLVKENLTWLICRKTKASHKNSTYSLLRYIINNLEFSKLIKINLTDLSITFGNGSKILFAGLDDSEKIKSIQGINKIWIEEATELEESDFDQLNLRLRGKNRYSYQIFSTFNPISISHWIREKIDNLKGDCYYSKTTWKDNKFLDETYKTNLLNLEQLNPYLYQVYCQGEFGQLQGLIFDKVEFLDELPEDIDIIDGTYGLDQGFSDPSVLVEIFKTRDNKFYVKEIFYANNLTNTDIISICEKKSVSRFKDIYCDSSRPELIAQLKRSNFNAKACIKGQNSVFDGIMFMKSLDIKIVGKNLRKDFENYLWKINTSQEQPDHSHSHGPDAVRYGIFSKWFKQGALKFIDRLSIGV